MMLSIFLKDKKGLFIALNNIRYVYKIENKFGTTKMVRIQIY
jgi:hypothetical protein